MPALKQALNKAAQAVSSALPASSSSSPPAPTPASSADSKTPAAALASSAKAPKEEEDKELTVYAVTLENDGSPAQGKTVRFSPTPAPRAILQTDPNPRVSAWPPARVQPRSPSSSSSLPSILCTPERDPR